MLKGLGSLKNKVISHAMQEIIKIGYSLQLMQEILKNAVCINL